MGHLVKIDRNGDILWRKSFQEIEQATDLTLTADGGICLVGYNATTNQYWLIKTNAVGVKIWAKRLEGFNGVASMLENKDGGFTILGGALVITNSEGETITQGPGVSTMITRFIQLPSGQYVLAGETHLVMLDTATNPLWDKPLPGARSVAATSDGNFVVMGYSDADSTIYLTKWDIDGNELWYKTYPQLDVRPYQLLWNKMVVNQNDEIAFIAFVDGVSAFIAKTDAEGNLLCARIQELNNLPVILENLVATSDNGFAVVGTRTGNEVEDLFVMKTDSICQTADLEIIHNVDGEVDTVYSKEFSFKYGPNPCSNLVTFEIQPTKPFDGKMMLVFYDAYGRIVNSEKVSIGNMPVFTDNLPSGMYFFRFMENGKTLGKGKLAVQR